MASNGAVSKNEQAHRFELPLENGEMAFIDYSATANGVIDMRHTEVPESAKGQGVGGKLVKGALDITQQEGSKVKPTCAFVAAYIERHPEYQNMVG